MKTLVLIPLESVPTRYTCEWLHSVPKFLTEKAWATGEFSSVKHAIVYPSAGNSVEVVAVDPDSDKEDFLLLELRGENPEQRATPGAFLNFTATNVWKSSQIAELAKVFDQLKDGDAIYFTDAWHPGVINARYMIDLSGKDIKIHAQWHAGYHDPADQLRVRIDKQQELGRTDSQWALEFERALFHAIDVNYYATEFYRSAFTTVLDVSMRKTQRTGLPMGYMKDKFRFNLNFNKKPLVVFPHRLAPEKGIDLFREAAVLLEQRGIECVVAMDVCRDKAEYHELLQRATHALSLATQETFGISMFESVLNGVVPIVPRRLAYSEQYCGHFNHHYFNFTFRENPGGYAEAVADMVESEVQMFQAEHMQSTVSQDLVACRDHLLENYVGDDRIARIIFKSMGVKNVG